MTKIAVVRVRGHVRIRRDIVRAFEQLNLKTRNYATIVDDTPATLGQIRKIQSFATWGPVSEETIKKMAPRKRSDGKCYALQPPRKGYGRKGVKLPFSTGGALGDRKEKINDLLLRMI
jgi:large subunit ribosomal protein L30